MWIAPVTARLGQWGFCPDAWASSHRNGNAMVSRQKPGATGPTSDSRTSHGPNASAQLPSSNAGKAKGWWWADRSIGSA